MPQIVLSNDELAELVWKHKDDIDACVLEIGSKHAELKLEHLCELKTLLNADFVPNLRKRWESVARDMVWFLAKFGNWLNENRTLIVGEPKPEAGTSTVSEEARGNATTVGDLPPIPPEPYIALQQEIRIPDHLLKGLMWLWQKQGKPPPFEEVSRAREVCLPSNVELRQYHNWVSLQDLLDHTVRRIMLSLPRREIRRMPTELTLTSKWGCEGDGDPNKGRKIYFLEHFWDYGVFVTALAPLKLESSTGETYFVNTKENLLKSCRPLKLELQELTSRKIREERESIQKEISELKSSEVEVGDKKFIIKHEVIVTEREKRGRPQQGEASLPLRDLCDEIMDQGELIVCDLVDESQRNCHPIAANDVFRSLLVASDPYFLMHRKKLISSK